MSSSGTGSSGDGWISFSSPLTDLATAFWSRPLRAPPKLTRPCKADDRLWPRSRLQHSLRKSLTRPKWSVLVASATLGTSQPGR